MPRAHLPGPSRRPVSSRVALALLTFVGALLTAAPSLAADWTEAGDAGDLVSTAQPTAGSGSLDNIHGTLAHDADVDVFCIRIVDEASFLARRTCAAISEPDLWLFTPGSLGVTHNDICQFSFTQLSSAFVSANGTYYLAITGNDGVALNGANAIWLSNNTGETAPDGPGAPGPLTGWGGNRVVTQTNYTIRLTGCEFCDAATSIKPETWSRLKLLYR